TIRPRRVDTPEARDLARGRDARIEHERAGSAQAIADRGTVAHVGDHIDLDYRLTRGIAPDPLRKPAVRFRTRRCLLVESLNAQPLCRDGVRVGRRDRLVGRALPDRNPRPWPWMVRGAAKDPLQFLG